MRNKEFILRSDSGTSLTSFLGSSALMLGAFVFCFFSGQRGFFPLDQSIVFDGAYRIVSGQLPLRDFVIPHSLLVLYYQAFLFSIMGTSYFSYLCGAALLNSIAVFYAIRILSFLFPTSRLSSLIAGLITAVWFFPPFGTPFGEECAFLCCLIAIDCIVRGLLLVGDSFTKGQMFYLAIAGLLSGFSFYCKQNVAFIVAPFFVTTPLLFTVPQYRLCLRATLTVCFGLVIGLLVPALIIYLQGGWRNFILFYLLLPFQTGIDRFSLLQLWLNLLNSWSLWLGIGGIVAGLGFLVRRHITNLFLALFRLSSTFRRTAFAAWICTYILIVSPLLHQSIQNSSNMTDILLGVLLGLVFGLIFVDKVVAPPSHLRNAYLGCVVIIIGFGVYLSWFRKVHESVDGSTFTSTLSIPNLESLRWGKPTMIRDGLYRKTDPGIDVTEEDMTRMVSYLKEKDRNFFIFPDFTILYGVVGKISPQPMLFFHRGLTYPSQYSEPLDQWIVKDLISHQIESVVIEENSFFGTKKRLDDFPLLKDFIDTHFVETKRIGLFKILSHR